MAGLAGNMVSLIKAVVLGTAMLVSLLAAAVPYWYTFHIMVSTSVSLNQTIAGPDK